MKNRMGRPEASATACNLVFIPPLVRPIRRPRPLFSTAGLKPGDVPSDRLRPLPDKALRSNVQRGDHHRYVIGMLCGQPFHDPCKHALFVTALESVAFATHLQRFQRL